MSLDPRPTDAELRRIAEERSRAREPLSFPPYPIVPRKDAVFGDAQQQRDAVAELVATGRASLSSSTYPNWHLEPLRLVMPMPPSLTNASGKSRHWRTVERARVQYFELCDVLVHAERWPAPPPQPLERATLASVMYLGGEMDEENAAARHKWPIDWLVQAQYLVDDRRKNLRWTAFPEQVVRRGQRYRLELTLTPIAE